MAAPHHAHLSTIGIVEKYLSSRGATLADPCLGKCAKKLPDLEGVLSSLVKVSKLNSGLMSDFAKATSSERFRLVTGDDVIGEHLKGHVALLAGTLSVNGGCTCHRKDEATSAFQKATCMVDYCDETFLKEAEDEEDEEEDKKELYLSIFKLLTNGLMHAPHLSKAAAPLYNRRSQAAYHLLQYQCAYEDLERRLACEGTEEPSKVANYLARKASVLLTLGEHEKAEAFLASRPAGAPVAGTPDGEMWETMTIMAAQGLPEGKAKRTVPMDKFHDTLPVIQTLVEAEKFQSHGRFPWLNAKLDLIFDTQESRFQLVSREKLDYGDIVAIGKPFASLGGFHLESVYDQCHHCSLSFPCTAYEGVSEDDDAGNARLAIQGLTLGPACMPAPIPCTACPNAVYCSEACRAEAWSLYHRFECSQLLALGKLNPAAHLALRMLYSAGSLEKIKQVVEKWDTEQDKLALIDSSRAYAFIYSMGQPEVPNVEEEFQHTVTALILAKLAIMSGFASATSDDDDDASFVAGILLRHLRQIKANVYVPRKGDPEDVSLSCLTSTMDFSCEPTVGCKPLFERASMLSNVTIFYAARAIGESSQLTVSYSTPYQSDYLVSAFDRQSSRHMSAFSSYHHACFETLALQTLSTFGEDVRFGEIASQFGVICKCARCKLEIEDNQCIQVSGLVFTYLPIGCPVCGRVMTRPKPFSPFFVCSMPACTGQMGPQQMSISYKKVHKLTSTILPALLSTSRRTGHLSEEVALTLTRKLADELAKVVPLFCGTSSHLALLYSRLSVLLVQSSGARDGHLSITFLKEACLYAEKSLSICERLDGADGFNLDNGPVVNCLSIASKSVGLAISQFIDQIVDTCACSEDGPHRCIIKQWLLLSVRLETAKKRTAYDQMLTEAKFISANVALFEELCQIAG